MRIGLEEVLGDRQPPDLSARILASLEQADGRSARQKDAGDRAILDATATLASRESDDPSAASKQVSAVHADATPASDALPHIEGRGVEDRGVEDRPGKRVALASQGRAKSSTLDWVTLTWSSLALVAAVCLSLASIIAITIAMRPSEMAGTASGEGDALRESTAPRIGAIPVGPVDGGRRPLLVEEPTTGIDGEQVAGSPTRNGTSGDPESPTNGTSEPRNVPDWQEPWHGLAVPNDPQIVRGINQGLQNRWVSANVEPSTGIDDVAWAERAFVALIGRRPDAYELVDFEVGNVDRAAWVYSLTQSPKYRPQFARTWAARISRHLLNRKSPSHRLVAPEAFQAFLAERLSGTEGIGYLVEELLTAEGGLAPSQDDFNPAVSYLVALDDGKGVAATQSILEKFWGEQARCAACHDYQGTPGLSQEEFWSTNSHLRQMVVEGNQESGLRLSSADFLGDLGDPEHVAVFYETPARELVATYPRFADGAEFPESGRLSHFDRRRALGRRIVTDMRFPETWVDWTWAQVLQYPLGTTEQDGDLRRQLALAFAADGFHLDHLLGWIVLSDAFNRSEAPASQYAADSPWRGTPALFSHRYAPRATFSSVNRALAGLESAYDEGLAGILAFRSGQAPSNANAPNPNGLANVDQEAIDWRLLEGWNADEALSTQLNHIVTSQLSVRKKIEHLFLLSLGTSASQEQLVRCEQMIEKSNEPLSVYRDIWFALSHAELEH